MGIGGSIFLIALGAILAFAVNADIGVLDLSIVGWVLMVAGFAGLIITIWFWQSRRRTVASRSAPRRRTRSRVRSSTSTARSVASSRRSESRARLPGRVRRAGVVVGRRSGVQREVDRDVVQDRGDQRAGVEELVVAEDGRPRVRPPQGVEHRTDAVRQPARAEQHQLGDAAAVQDVRQDRHRHPAEGQVERRADPARQRPAR